MDIIDQEIIRLLQANARISASDISKSVDLSISAIGDRLRKLESTKLIKQYTAILEPEMLEKELSGFMLIGLQNPNACRVFLDFVETENDILSCFYLAGEFDYMVKIVTKNTTTLAVVLNRIKSLDGVVKTNTMVVLGTEKDYPTYMI